MAKPDLGAKRQCLNCGTKFFDLNKAPITCPKCGTIFEQATASAPAARPSRASTADDDEPETEDNAEVVSLEDADSNDDGKVAAASTEDSDGDDDNSSDDEDTFLEEDEEEDGDVSNLIDGDIEDDEER